MLDIFQLVLSKNCTQTKARWTDLAFLGLLIQLFILVVLIVVQRIFGVVHQIFF